MKCPKCESKQIRKNGHRSDKQNYLCKNCGRQFVESYSQRGDSDDAKQICLKMHQNNLGFREIERLTGISHNIALRECVRTYITSVKNLYACPIQL